MIFVMTDIAYGVYTSNIQCNSMNSNKEARVNKGGFLTIAFQAKERTVSLSLRRLL